jgi:hypothetical protein
VADVRLERELAALAAEIAWPVAPDLAGRVANRLAGAPVPRRRRWSGWPPWLPVRRSILVAAILLLALAAAVAAAGLLLPGLRIVLVPAGSPLPSTTSVPAPSGAAVGSALGLGARVDLADVPAAAGFAPVLPPRDALGAPDEVYVSLGRVNMLWRTTADLPTTAGTKRS